jgi:hypothetical protein
MPFGQFHIKVQSGTDAMGAVQVWRLVCTGHSLLLRRLPIMMAMYRGIPDVKTWSEAVFSGHFGPMGIGAIFISTLASQFLLQHIAGNPSTTADQQHQIEYYLKDLQRVFSGFDTLSTRDVTKSSATQRAGRAGREVRFSSYRYVSIGRFLT